MLVALVSSAVGVLVGYVAPRLAKRTKTKVDDKIVEYAKAHLPDIVEFVVDKLSKGEDPVAVKAVERPRVVDHRRK